MLTDVALDHASHYSVDNAGANMDMVVATGWEARRGNRLEARKIVDPRSVPSDFFGDDTQHRLRIAIRRYRIAARKRDLERYGRDRQHHPAPDRIESLGEVGNHRPGRVNVEPAELPSAGVGLERPAPWRLVEMDLRLAVEPGLGKPEGDDNNVRCRETGRVERVDLLAPRERPLAGDGPAPGGQERVDHPLARGRRIERGVVGRPARRAHALQHGGRIVLVENSVGLTRRLVMRSAESRRWHLDAMGDQRALHVPGETRADGEDRRSGRDAKARRERGKDHPALRARVALPRKISLPVG